MSDHQFDKKIAARACRILEIAQDMADRAGLKYSHVNDIQFYYEGYANGSNAGKSGIISAGNWNDDNTYDKDTRQRVKTSNLPSRVLALFERMGIECDWSDTISTCDDCGRVIQTEPDSYCWQPEFVVGDGDITCEECIANDAESHLESLEGDTGKCNTLDSINPANHGYVKLNEDSYETGWHAHQIDSPKAVAKELEALGISRFLFNLDENGQFDSRWSCFVHDSEIELLNPPKKSGVAIVQAVDYEDATENFLGWCKSCQDFTTSECEPDAHDRECENCGESIVVGAEDALMTGMFELTEEE